tara:strand:- start:4245 stop:5756 length:1512 start_codon:yes stop_codon:yes gene_type:complete
VDKLISLKNNAIANYIGQIYSVFIGIIILPLYMSYLGAEAFGLIGFFTMLSGWMALLDVGLSATIARQSASLKKSKEGIIKLRNILRSVEFIFVIIAIIIFILVYANRGWVVSEWLAIVNLEKSSVSYSIALMGLLVGLRWMTGIYKGVINGFEDQVWLNIYLVFVNTLRFVGGLVVVVFFSQDIVVYFEYQIAIGIIELVIIIIKTYSKFPKSNVFIRPSYDVLKEIAPFSLSIAYTSALWVALTQVDKLLLSNVLTLVEYGYFALVVVIINGISILSNPIGSAIRPRMTSLIAQGKEVEMLALYRKSSQFVAIIAFTVSGVVATFSEELLYVWTGNIKVAKWGAEILTWYVLGSGALMVLEFQYYLQFAYGNLRYHVLGNTYFGIFQIIVMVIAVYEYGAIGAAISWFFLQSIFLVIWPTYIHKKFAPGLHKKWFTEDILPFIFISFFVLFFLNNLNIDKYNFNRFELGLVLISIGLFTIFCNILYSTEAKRFILKLTGFK